jgi:hypothetical protein
MQMPFTERQFLELFRVYNNAIWPAQLAAYLLGLVCVIVLIARPRWHSSFLLWTLALLWLWNGIAYHWIYFRTINPAATLFAVMVVGQALLLAGYSMKRLPDRKTSSLGQIAGWIMVAYAMAGYAVLGQALGHTYPANPVFGVAPCPTTIFTFGVLSLLGTAVPRRLFVIPAIWAFIGTSAALTLGMREDIALPVAAILAIWIRLSHGKRAQIRIDSGSVASR